MIESVKHIRIINGDEVFGIVESESSDKIQINTPMVLEEKYDPSGQTMLTLSKYVPFSVNPIIELQKSHVISCEAVHFEMERYYLNSLYYTNKRENVMLDNIASVNKVMEELYAEEQFSANATHIGTTSIN